MQSGQPGGPRGSGPSPISRALPQSLEAELSVLGGILLDNNALNNIADVLKPEHFYRESHAAIFQAMQALAERAAPVDLVTLGEELRGAGELERIGGHATLSSLLEAVPTAAHVPHYARIVADKATVRRIIQIATEIADEGYGDVPSVVDFVDSAETRIFEAAGARKRDGVTPIKPLVKEAFAKLERLFEQKEEFTGVRSGFHDLDRITAGFQPGNLIIMAARPGMGKTSFALNMAVNASARHKTATAVFSLEMSNDELVQRMLCSEARIDQSRMRTGHVGEADWPKLIDAAKVLSSAPLFLDDSAGLTALDLRAKARRLAADHNLGLLIIDYLQLMKGRTANSESREREISEISRSLKQLAKELKIPVIALSQLNRGIEKREDRKPKLADLRESGAIEQDADMILFIDREDMYKDDPENKGLAEVIIGKHRNGPTGSIKLRFFNQYTLFANLEANAAPF